MSVTLINKFTAQPGKGDALEQMWKGWEEGVRAAPGCNSLQLLRSSDDPNVILAVEDWESEDAHKAFMASIPEEGMAEAMQVMAGMPEAAYYSKL